MNHPETLDDFREVPEEAPEHFVEREPALGPEPVDVQAPIGAPLVEPIEQPPPAPTPLVPEVETEAPTGAAQVEPIEERETPASAAQPEPTEAPGPWSPGPTVDPIEWVDRRGDTAPLPDINIDSPVPSIDERRLVFRTGPTVHSTYWA